MYTLKRARAGWNETFEHKTVEWMRPTESEAGTGAGQSYLNSVSR